MLDSSCAGIPLRCSEAYAFHDREILITACGRICLHRKKINLSTVFAGQTVGIKEVDDAIWLVSFMHYDLGYIDLEQRTLQPLRPKVVTHVLGTFRYPCLRVGQLNTGAGEGIRTLDPNLGKVVLYP
jgi:hypothetical protein